MSTAAFAQKYAIVASGRAANSSKPWANARAKPLGPDGGVPNVHNSVSCNRVDGWRSSRSRRRRGGQGPPGEHTLALRCGGRSLLRRPLTRPFRGDVVQSRDLPGSRDSKSGVDSHRFQLVKNVVHLSITVRDTDEPLQQRNAWRANISSKHPPSRPQYAKHFPKGVGPVLIADVMEGQTGHHQVKRKSTKGRSSARPAWNVQLGRVCAAA